MVLLDCQYTNCEPILLLKLGGKIYLLFDFAIFLNSLNLFFFAQATNPFFRNAFKLESLELFFSFTYIQGLYLQFPTELEKSVHSGPVYYFTNLCIIYPHFYKSLFRLEGGPPADLWFACIGLPPGSYMHAHHACLPACTKKMGLSLKKLDESRSRLGVEKLCTRR